MALPEVVQVERAWRALLLERETATMEAMATRYLQLAARLMADFESLAEQVTRMAEAGDAVGVGKLYQLERFQRMAAMMEAQWAEFMPYAEGLISAQQAYLLEAGMENAREQMNAIETSGLMPAGAGYGQSYVGLIEGWPAGAVEHLVGQTQGGPLAALLAAATEDTTADIGAALVEGVGLGHNPTVVAREMYDRFGMPLARCNCIARTEMLSAFRASTLEGYRQAGVQWYQRMSSQDGVVCAGCASAEGELFPTYEDFEDHPNCRCSCIPYWEGAWEFPMGEEWFNGEDEATQRSILGNTRYEMYKNKEVEWRQFATRTESPVWGGSIGATSIRDLKAGLGGIPELANAEAAIPVP
jgi:SPP1 gp7 family putative phage head morphogenesis protein